MFQGPLVWLTALFCYYRIVVSGLLTQLLSWAPAVSVIRAQWYLSLGQLKRALHANCWQSQPFIQTP